MSICIDYPSTDKVRFVDLEVDRDPEKPPYIYAIEVSNGRSTGHFLSFFVTGKTKEMRGWMFRISHDFGLDLSKHDPDACHLDGQNIDWPQDYFPGSRPFWGTTHYHIWFNRPPDYGLVKEIMENFQEGVSDKLRRIVIDQHRKEAA